MGLIGVMGRKQKHIPQRTCVICRQKFDKRHLMRLVRTDLGVFLDTSGKRDGRGAYICDNSDCRTRAVSTDILNKALRTVLNEEDRQRLREIAS